MRRTVTPELLDSDAGTPEEIATSLADLRRINSLFGGVRTGTHLLRRYASHKRSTDISVLDVGSASGDVPSAIKSKLNREGIRMSVTLLDRSEAHLPKNGDGFRTVIGDALDLPFERDAFDVVTCSLFVHHLEPDEIRRFALEGLRVARHALIINDLHRSALHLALIYAGMPLFRSRITRFDSLASIRRSYTESELRGILSGIGSGAEFSRHYLCRVGVIVWK